MLFTSLVCHSIAAMLCVPTEELSKHDPVEHIPDLCQVKESRLQAIHGSPLPLSHHRYLGDMLLWLPERAYAVYFGGCHELSLQCLVKSPK
jgi:hypothetical protein